MDDFYTACQEKMQNASAPTAAITELMAISLHDLPQMQICKFAEQTVTLLSVISQVGNGSSQDLTSQFKQIRHQLEMTLDYMEQIMEMEKDFPSPPPGSDGCWW